MLARNSINSVQDYKPFTENIAHVVLLSIPSARNKTYIKSADANLKLLDIEGCPCTST